MSTNAPEPHHKRRDWFVMLAVGYLALPNLIFLATWVRPGIGIPAAGIVLAGVIYFLAKQSSSAEARTCDWKSLALVLAVAAAWTFLAGMGGWLPQTTDYVKHNLVYHDLIHSDWPVTYETAAGAKNYLCYSLGYYLPPAFVARFAGEAALPWLTYLWGTAGVMLFFYWLATVNQSPKTNLLAFLLFATTGFLWFFLKDDYGPRLIHLGLYHSYNDSFNRIAYQPQHAVAAWLGTALLYELLWKNSDARGAGFVWSLILLWSPLTGLGLLLFVPACWKRIRLASAFEPLNLLCGGLLVVIMGIFYQGHGALPDSGPIWRLSEPWWPVFYLLFVALQLSPAFLLLAAHRRYGLLPEWRPLFNWSLAFLLVLPFYRLGFFSDLRLEASAPALVIFALAAAQWLNSKTHFPPRLPLFVMLAVALAIGAFFPAFRPWTNLISNRQDQSCAATVKRFGYHNLSEYHACPELFEPFDVSAQYLGREDSFAGKYLLR